MIYRLLFFFLIVHVTLGKSKQREAVRENDEDTIDLDGPSKDHVDHSDLVPAAAAADFSGGRHPDNDDNDNESDDEGDSEVLNDDVGEGSSEGDDHYYYSGDQGPCIIANQRLDKSKTSSKDNLCDDRGFFKLRQTGSDGETYCVNEKGDPRDCPDPFPKENVTPVSATSKVDIKPFESSKSPNNSRPPSSALRSSFLGHPGLLAAIIGGAIVGLLCAVLLVMFLVYRMKKKDEGSYALDEPNKRGRSPAHMGYQKAPSKEYYA